MISILSVVYGIITFAVPGVLRTCIGTVYAEVENSSNGDHLPIFPQDSSAVVIIGGAGFIGSSLASALLDKGLKQLSVLDSFNIDKSVITKRHRAEQLFSDHGFNIDEKEIDMCVAGALFERLQQHSFTHITLLAPPAKDFVLGEQKISNKLRDKYESDSTRCFTTVLDAIVQAGTHHGTIPKLVFALPAISRSEELDSAKLHERELRLHHSLLDLAQLYHARHGLVSVGLRLTDVYGPGDNPGSDVYRYASQAMRGVPIVLSAQQAKKQYHITYIDDVVEGIISAMNYPATSPTAFELSSNVTLNVGDILGAVAFRGRKNITLATPNDLLINSSSDLPVHSPTPSSKHFLDKERFSCAHMELGFQASVGFKSGMGRFMEWFRRTESRVFPCASECATPRLCFRSTWDSVAETSKELTQGCQNVFYTVAIDGTVDGLHVLPKFYDDQSLTCNIAFVTRDSPLVKSTIANTDERISTKYYSYGNWTMVLVDEFTSFSDPRKPTRVPKLSPGKFFASTVQHAVYMDSKLLLTSDPREFIGMTQADYPGNKGRKVSLLAVRISEHLDGLFYHIDHVLARLIERPSITFYEEALRQQKRAYREFEARQNIKFLNIYDGAFLVHDLRTVVGMEFRCDWYKEYQQWSDRDQVAGTFALTRRAQAMHSKAANQRKNSIPLGVEPTVGDTYRAYGHASPTGADLQALRQRSYTVNTILGRTSFLDVPTTHTPTAPTVGASTLATTAPAAAVAANANPGLGATVVPPLASNISENAHKPVPPSMGGTTSNLRSPTSPTSITTTPSTLTTAGTSNSSQIGRVLFPLLSTSQSREQPQQLGQHHQYTPDQSRKKARNEAADVRYVRLLPRKEYHWDSDCAPNRIGRLEFFTWNRLDDNRYKNMASIMAELERQRTMKICIRWACYLLVAILAVYCFRALNLWTLLSRWLFCVTAGTGTGTGGGGSRNSVGAGTGSSAAGSGTWWPNWSWSQRRSFRSK